MTVMLSLKQVVSRANGDVIYFIQQGKSSGQDSVSANILLFSKHTLANITLNKNVNNTDLRIFIHLQKTHQDGM